MSLKSRHLDRTTQMIRNSRNGRYRRYPFYISLEVVKNDVSMCTSEKETRISPPSDPPLTTIVPPCATDHPSIGLEKAVGGSFSLACGYLLIASALNAHRSNVPTSTLLTASAA
jgi:hypothetical protein